MFEFLGMALGWLPLALRVPVFALLAALIILVVVKLVAAILSVLSTVLDFFTFWI